MCPIEKKSPSLSISVVIPTLNEANTISQCLQQPPLTQFDEVLIVDGGSSDATIEIAKQFPYQIINSDHANRAHQMNLGAKHSTSDILLFLHADTLLPEDATEQLLEAIRADYTCGCFRRIFTPRTPLLDFTSELAYWRTRLFFWAFGDQAIFVTREHFELLQGYREISPFEDLDFSRRAKQQGSHKVIDSPIQTSARRFADAPLKRLLKDFGLSLCYFTGLYRPK